MKQNKTPFRFTRPGIAMGAGIGTVLGVSSGWGVGIGIGVAVALCFSLTGRKTC